MFNDYTVQMLQRAARKDAARKQAQHELRKLATDGRRPWFVSLAARLLPLRSLARPAQPKSEPCYVVPCQPASDSLNL